MVRTGLLLAAILAAGGGAAQDRKTAALQKKLERALQEVNPRDAKAAVERLVEAGGADAAQTLAEALGEAVYRIDNFRRSHYAYFDEYYEYLYNRREPSGTDRPTMLEQIHDKLKDLEKTHLRMREIRSVVRAALAGLPAADTFPVLSKRLLEARFWRERAEAAELFADLQAPDRDETLLRALASDPEPTVRVPLLDALGKSKAPTARLIDKVSAEVASEYWSIRFAAIEALRKLGRPEGIDALVTALGETEGRTQYEVRQALRELTRGRAPQDDKQVAAWWKENREKALKGELDTPPAEGDRGTRVAEFFTLPLHSRRIAFVVDVSKSMMTSARWNPAILLGSKSDRLKPDSSQKFAIAEFQLLRAFDSLPEGSRFALILYAEVQRTFELGPKTLDGEMRKRIAEYLRTVEIDGETDLFAAADQALVYANQRDGRIRKDGLDTVYLLSDGEPTMGLLRSMDPILEEVTERNRYSKVALHTVFVGRPDASESIAFMRGLAQRNYGTFALATR